MHGVSLTDRRSVAVITVYFGDLLPQHTAESDSRFMLRSMALRQSAARSNRRDDAHVTPDWLFFPQWFPAKDTMKLYIYDMGCSGKWRPHV